MRSKGVVMALAGLALWIIFTGNISYGQGASYQQTISKFFELLKQDKTVEAVDFLYSGNPWVAKKADAVQNVKDQINSLPNLVGKLHNLELLEEKVVGNRIATVLYLAAYDRQPMRFVFQFYRPQEAWVIYSFSFDYDLDEAAEGQVKTNYFN